MVILTIFVVTLAQDKLKLILMENENKYKILFFVLLIILIFGLVEDNLKEENTTLTDQVNTSINMR